MIDARCLGAAVIGLGVGEQHARTYAALPNCRLSMVYDLDQAKAERLSAELGVRAARTLEEVLADADSEVVSIASYDQDHCAHLLAVLRAGKHAFVEKPICRSEDELATIGQVSRARPSLHVGSNLVLRAAPLYRWLCDAVARGEFGEIYAFDGDYLYGRLQKITTGWRSHVDDYSVLLGGGVHLIDLMLRIAGQRPLRVQAAGNRISTRATAFRYDDFVAATYEFPSGLVGRITANFGCVHRHQHVVRVFGTEATFIHDDMGPRVYRTRAPEEMATIPQLASVPPSKGALIGDFVDSIVSGRDASRALQSELDVIAVCLAADRALASREQGEIRYE